MIGLAGAILICLLVGWCVERGLFKAPSRDILETIGRSLALGIGTVGAFSILVDGLGLGVSLATVGGAALIVVALLIKPAISKQSPPHLQKIPLHPGLKITGVLLLFFAAFMLGVAVYSGWIRPVYNVDALARWMFKTKALAVDGTLLGPLCREPEFHFTHQRYPPLVCHVANVPALLNGAFDDRIASAIFPWYAVALVLVVYGSLARSSGWLKGTIAAAWIAGLPLIAFRHGVPPAGVPPGAGAFAALADVPFTLFATCAVLSALDVVDGRRDRALLEMGLMLAFAALTKNEGLPLIAGTVLALLLCAPKKRWLCAGSAAAIALIVYALLWGRVAHYLPALDEHYPGRLNLQALSEGLHRVPGILSRFAEELWFLPSWNLTWPAVIGLVLVSGRRLLNRATLLLVIVLVFQLTSYVLAFTITSWTNPTIALMGEGADAVTALMDCTLGRLFLHVAPMAIVLALRAAPLKPSTGNQLS